MHKKKAGKLQTGNTFPKQYWLAVNGKPIMFPTFESNWLTKTVEGSGEWTSILNG